MRWLPFLAPVALWAGEGLSMESKITDGRPIAADGSKPTTFDDA
jgi:hypothetical protein